MTSSVREKMAQQEKEKMTPVRQQTKRGLKSQKQSKKLLQRKKPKPKNLSRFSKIARPQKFHGVF